MNSIRQCSFLICLVLTIPSGICASESSADVTLGQRLFFDVRLAQNSATAPVSCATCHQLAPTGSTLPAFSGVPSRNDGQTQTPRHPQELAGAVESATEGWGLLHWDGEFTSIEDLVAGTFTGRNFGWLPGEKAEAIRHVAGVMRGEAEIAALLRDSGVNPAAATDAQVLAAGGRAVGAYLKTLRYSRAESGLHNGSPYDAFLAANRLPQVPAAGEIPIRYARRLHEAVAALRKPRFIDDPTRPLAVNNQPFRFGEQELRGLRIFLRGALGYGQSSGAGNCAECHVPPHFTDFAFHNTGGAQDGYDAGHGAGAFLNLKIPSLTERAAQPERWLPASPQHPKGSGVFRSPVAKDAAERADLGLWNVYGNPDLPASQKAIERKLNPEGRLTPDEVLVLTTGRFKTPTVRGLGTSEPYLHSGRLRAIEEVLDFYRRMSDLAREGKLRNAPKEFHSMRLQSEDMAPLAAFLRSLNENVQAGN